MVNDTATTFDQLPDASQRPAIGLEAVRNGPLLKGLQKALPLLRSQVRRASWPASVPEDIDPRGRSVAKSLRPSAYGPQTDPESLRDFCMGEPTGSEQPASFQATLFELFLS